MTLRQCTPLLCGVVLVLYGACPSRAQSQDDLRQLIEQQRKVLEQQSKQLEQQRQQLEQLKTRFDTLGPHPTI